MAFRPPFQPILRPFALLPHVETLVCLSKKTDKHINIDVEFGEGEGQVSLKDIEQALKNVN